MRGTDVEGCGRAVGGARASNPGAHVTSSARLREHFRRRNATSGHPRATAGDIARAPSATTGVSCTPIVAPTTGGLAGWLSRIADAKLVRPMSHKGYSADNAACEGSSCASSTRFLPCASRHSTGSHSECDGSLGSIDERLKALSVPLVCTGHGDNRHAKKRFCEKLGIKIDIWIDDNPQAVHMDARSIWGDSSAQGAVVVPHYD